MNDTKSPRGGKAAYTVDDLAMWGEDLARIRDAARRKRLLGYPDVALEMGCAVLERRLAEMRREVSG
jgi:hypothetical protein